MSTQSLKGTALVDVLPTLESEENPPTSSFPPDSPDELRTEVGSPGKCQRWTPDPKVTARVHRPPVTSYYAQESFHLFDSPSEQFYRQHSALSRPDRPVRTRVRDMIGEIMLSESDPSDAVDLLDACRGQCAAAGVSFSELLDLDIDAHGAPPLVVEITRAKWAKAGEEVAPPLVIYLLEHTNQRNVAMYICRAAMLRGDDEVYQSLRHYIPEDSLPRGTVPLYDNEVAEGLGSEDFTMRLQVDGLAALLRDPPQGNVIKGAGMVPVEAAGLTSFIACNRLWELRVGSNSLVLKLVQGDATHVDARVIVLLGEVHQLLLPRAALQPVSGRGQHSIVLSPCFSGGFIEGQGPTSLTDGGSAESLVLEMHVTLHQIASTSGTIDHKAEGSSDAAGGEWDIIETDSVTDADAGWVKASWSGQDEEL